MLKTLVIILSIISLGLTYGAIILEPEYSWILWLILSVIVLALIGLIVYAIYRYKKNQKTQVNEQQLLLKQDKEILKEIFKLSAKALDGNLNNYKLPFYIMLGVESKDEELILAQNEFQPVLDEDVVLTVGQDTINNESDSYLKFWHSDSAVVVVIGHRIFDEDGVDKDLWKEFIKLLYKYRPQQVANGLIYTLGCSFIQSGDKTYHDKVIQSTKDAILSLNKQVGIELPVFLALTNADSIKDFVTFFKYFEDKKTDKILGFTLKPKARNHFDLENYHEKAKSFVEYFSMNTMKFLKNIPEEDARSVLSFPYQMSLFFNLLAENLQVLAKENKLKKCVWIHGIYFLVPNQQKVKFDLLSQLVASRADFSTEAQTSDLSFDKKRYFVQNFFAEAVLPFAKMLGVNKPKKIRSIVGYIITLIIVASILSSTFFFYYKNWTDYIVVRNDVENFVNTYKSELSKVSFGDVNTLDDVVTPLERLREKSVELDKKFKFYNIVSYEQYMLPKKFKKFYQEQLKQVLLKKLELSLRENLYNLDNIDNSDIIYSGTGAYMMLFDKSILDKEYFFEYLDTHVLPYQYFDENVKPLLKNITSDLFDVDYDKANIREDIELVSTLKHKMNAVSVEDMLYELIKLNKQYSYKVNIKEKFGRNFNSLFTFNEDYNGYMIPFMYTKEGFLTIDLSANSPELKRLLKNLKLVKGNIDLTDDSIRKIVSRVQQKYYRNYIDYWMDLIRNINVKNLDSFDEVRVALDKATSERNGSLESLVHVLVENTNLTNAYMLDDDNTSENNDEGKNKKVTLKELKKEKLNGKVIASEFDLFFSFVGVDEKLEYSNAPSVPFNQLLKQIADINNIFKQIDSKGLDRGKNVFDFATKNLFNSSEIFELRSIIDNETPVFFEELITSLYSNTTSSIGDMINDYIKNKWNYTVVSEFKRNFKNKFPFDQDSANEVSIAKFESFFGQKGTLDTFYNSYLKYFVVQDANGDYQIANNDLFMVDIPYSIIDELQNANYLREVFFKENKASLKFNITPRKLTGKAKLFEYKDSYSYCSYNQGPRQSCTITWPISSNNDITLSFTSAKNAHGYGKRYKSEWGLLRVIMDSNNSSFTNVVRNGSQLWVYNIDDYQITYDLVLEGQENLKLPIDIFDKFNFYKWN